MKALSVLVMLFVCCVAIASDKIDTSKRYSLVSARESGPVDTANSIKAIEVLLGKTIGAREKLIEDIEKNSSDYIPAVFFALADNLWKNGKNNDAYFWFHAGRLRTSFDAARCTDETARSALGALNYGIPRDLIKSQYDDSVQLREILARVVKWDQETPYNYDHRWIYLHGLRGMDLNSIIKEDAWPALAKKQRDEYIEIMNQNIEQIRKARESQK